MNGERSMGGLATRREAMVAAVTALRGLSGDLYQAGGAELGRVLGELDGLVVAAEAARVMVVREAMDRGETGAASGGGPSSTTVTQWLRHWAPSLRAGGAGPVVAVATAFGKAVNAPVQRP